MTTTLFTSKSGQQYDIDVTDGSEILVTKDGKKCGSILLSYRECDGDDYYHITNLGLEGCKGQGVGRQCLKMHKETFGSPLTAGSSHNGKQDDGSHLTGDGPGFIKKMREEGIVCRERNYDEPRDYEFE
ncbi:MULTISPECIES: hypothetical protein [Burkholderiales]|jgi:hypothetical protein|uniref:hypothetical protein n=1 Tax=Burkholderiales TaxID=80840 RepID=UPI001BFDA1B5|nr:hypothetical protein [Polynucleobacter sp. MWH-Aus1W21]QWD66006.1 hypothetical protein ICW03_10225 [Polynucleobacter sp. MWH-Aus1W21]